ncbi:MAG: DUF1972 domain-containing protein [Bacteroidetes bacterium]|nr:DUF1972 domain-containing protein [Bacteroidota bacterium]
MKIAILGTRGIPNNYGGFEQFAEYLSEKLVAKGHEVSVYNSHNHSYQEKKWRGVSIIHKFDPEYKIGTKGQFIYDLNCILDSRKRNFDIILQLGYTSSAVWNFLFPQKSIILTNMDGLEWKRTKYSKRVQNFLKYAEKLAVKKSHVLIADSLGIKKYLKETYNAESEYIPYGANTFSNPNSRILATYHLAEKNYDMLIARLEPENSIDIILEGVSRNKTGRKFIVIGNNKTNYGQYLTDKYKGFENIVFLGSIYDMEAVNNLRYFSNLYFHGHTVGGTNPSLLEAMASNALIVANKNDFNASILGNDAYYFSSSSDVENIVNLISKNQTEEKKLNANLTKIKEKYSWDIILDSYEKLFIKSMLKN